MIARLSRREALGAGVAAAASPALGREAGQGPPKRWLTLPPTPGLPEGGRTAVVPVNGARLFYARFGPDAGEPVLFLHGGLGSSDHWGRQIAELARRHPVIAMDTRGHGRSPLPSQEFGFALFARDVEGLLDHLGIGSSSIVGWSDGGITGLRLAMTRPGRVRRLFAFGANVTPAGLIGGGSRQPAFARYLARCRAEYTRLSPAPERWPDLAAGMAAMWRREPHYGWADLARIDVPTTIALAEHDEIIRREHAERIARTIPRSRRVVLKDVSHFAMLQDPDGFNAALTAFLRA